MGLTIHIVATIEQLEAHARPALQCALPSTANGLCIMWARASLRKDRRSRLLKSNLSIVWIGISSGKVYCFFVVTEPSDLI